MGNDGRQGAFLGVGPHVHLINNVIPEGQTGPSVITPGKMRVKNLGGTVHPLGLVLGSRVRPLLVSVQPEKVQATWLHPFQRGGEIASGAFGQRQQALMRGNLVQFHLIRKRSPHQEMAAAVSQIGDP